MHSASSAFKSPACQPPRILFVDDDDLVLRAFRRSLRGSGFTVDIASNFDEGVALAQADGTYSIIAVDYRLPELDGLTLAERLREHQPEAIFILISGECDLELAVEAVNNHDIAYLVPKPWQRDELLSVLDRSLMNYWEKHEQHKLAKNAVKITQQLRTTTSISASDSPEAHKRLTVLKTLVASQMGTQPKKLRETSSAAGVSTLIAKHLAVGGETTEVVRCAAWLWDIDDKTVSPRLGERPGHPDPQQPLRAAALLQTIPEIREVATVVAQRHERWDGRGYPQQLAGDSISMASKIASVGVDLSHRIKMFCETGAPTIEASRQALTAMGQSAGKLYDPHMISAVQAIGATAIAAAWQRGDREVVEGLTVSQIH